MASYLLRFVETKDERKDNARRKFSSWENTVLVKARSLEHAYAKVTKIGRAKTRPYRGGPKGIPVRWIYEGVTDLLPVYEKLRDGAERAHSQDGEDSARAGEVEESPSR